MTNDSKLVLVKTIHTLVWIFFNLVLAYLFYEVLTNQVSHWFWIGIGLIVLECIVLVVNNWSCPLTPLARKYTDSTADNFDIYIPNWLAKHNKTIYTAIFVVLMLVYFMK